MLKYIKIIFYFLKKKLFLRSVYQNDPKYIKKNLIFSKTLNILKIRVQPRFQTFTKNEGMKHN